MNRKRIGLYATLGLAFLLAATEPVLAQSSKNEALINGLNGKLLWVGIPITILVEGILIYTVWKYRNNDDPTPTRENRRLEITWTLATAAILLFVGLGSFLVMGSPYVAPSNDTVQAQQQIQPAVTMNDTPGAIAPTDPDAVQVEVEAYQWAWNFNYVNNSDPSGTFSSSGTLVIPANTEVSLHVISDDVLHAVHVPALGLKQDAFPGQYNTIETNVSQTGSFQLYCAEYCGSGHSKMIANMTVLPPNEYQSWVQEQRAGSSSSGNSSSESSSGNSSAGSASANGSSSANSSAGGASSGNNSANASAGDISAPVSARAN